jgi:hypothetical protein
VLVTGLPAFTDPQEVYEVEKALYTLFAEYNCESISIGIVIIKVLVAKLLSIIRYYCFSGRKGEGLC